MKRVLCLYRVSTKGQVDEKDDIPRQRRECHDFIDKMEDWEFYDERLEKGVSGFKVATSKRDEIQEIRALAEKKKFDVLLVFMFDRLGRREDETPFLVQWFIEHGIEVWSTREGQQRLDNRVDKLLNFMRYWQAGGESEKTSMRVKAAHTQMTADGIWRGGTRPFGYKLTHNGRIGKKNRPLYDLSIDEVEGPIVKEVFDLIIHEGYGTLRAANYLNDKYASLGKIWTAQTIRSMLRNVIYTGRMHMNDTISAPNEALRIISDEDLEFAKYALSARIPRKYHSQRKAEDEAFLAEPWALDTTKTVNEALAAQIAVIGENMHIRRFAQVKEENGFVASYTHMGGKIGVLVDVETDVVNDAVKEMARNVAMQIAALKPQYTSDSEVSAEYIEHEKEILLAQIRNDPKESQKPEKVIQGMITGRIKKELKEICLLDQVYVKAEDGKQTVAKYVEEVAKANGAKIAIKGFVRFETGEGIEKRQDDFAAEVAAQVAGK